ncbi:FG-GAP repeat protein [Bradyrhizobium sp. Cp5.3]|uniref:FG-GAP repeat protein n=1 Tax=Bradyrhizobium sp. Cp5.3 TaxID=443598 RepID=UPI00040B129C|nr:FG-GAP repeat protein [Bradyrhizobium sp. Cp5.3]
MNIGPDKSAPDPAKGVFASDCCTDTTIRLLKSGSSASIKLTPVALRVRYVPKSESRTDPKDQVITQDLVDVLAGREIARFIASQRLGSPRLNAGQNLAVALVQEFDAALSAPGHKEHIWSINWRVETNPGKPDDYVGYEAWGLFTRVNGALKPFHLAARESWSSGENSNYFYVLATGDLDGDGIDEMVVREMVFEGEEDLVQLWAWERGMPVTISKIP